MLLEIHLCSLCYFMLVYAGQIVHTAITGAECQALLEFT